jgi:hypothetical protein
MQFVPFRDFDTGGDVGGQVAAAVILTLLLNLLALLVQKYKYWRKEGPCQLLEEFPDQFLQHMCEYKVKKK